MLGLYRIIVATFMVVNLVAIVAAVLYYKQRGGGWSIASIVFLIISLVLALLFWL